MDSYLNKGHNLYVDNWYTSPALFELLHRNRQGLPPLTDRLKRGEIHYFHTNILLTLKWQDKRGVPMLSTIHSQAYARSGNIDQRTGEDIRKTSLYSRLH
jgi:hypothetical protein